MTTTKKNTPVAGQGNEGNEQITEYNSASHSNSLSQKMANIILAMILDTHFSDRSDVIDVKELTVADVEEICHRFRLPLADVLELVRYEVEA